MFNRSRLRSEAVESSIPNWVVYVLLSIVSLLVASSVHGGILVMTGLGIVTLFTLSYLSKPVADIQPVKEKNIFDKNQINRSTWNNPSEPNAQRKRYLKSLNDNQRRAA
tara:strand:+ start:1446 stop:1772 length:327 start_codon:yes stop_codon:yes gene_type:complete